MAVDRERKVYRSEPDQTGPWEGQLNVVQVRLKPDLPLYSSRPVIGSRDAAELIADELKDWDREAFCILNLNTKGIPINMSIASIGTISEATVHPREIYKSSILSSAAATIFFHNHPSSGDPTPSDTDIQTTRRLIEAGNLLGIKALDHIIVGRGGMYFSFQENDLLFNEPQLQSYSDVAADTEAGYTADAAAVSDTKAVIGNTKKQTFREKVAESFLKSLQDAPREWTKSWASNDTGRPRNMVSGRIYRGLNMAYLKYVENLRGFHDPRWLTYKQASEAGYRIPKGTKMTSVEYFFMYDNLTKKTISWSRYNALSEDEKSQRVNAEEGGLADASATGRGIRPRYELRHRDHYVFNASQLQGVPAFEHNRTVHDINPSAVVDAVAGGMGVPIDHKEQDRAFYSPALDRITLPLRSQFFSDYDYQSTALHELGHATGAQSRLNRNIQNGFGTPEYAYEELIAEITSCFMGEYATQPMSEADMDNHLAYVQEWIQRIQQDDSYLFRAIREAEKAADYMIEKGDLVHLKEESLEKAAKPYRIALYTAQYSSGELEALNGAGRDQ